MNMSGNSVATGLCLLTPSFSSTQFWFVFSKGSLLVVKMYDFRVVRAMARIKITVQSPTFNHIKAVFAVRVMGSNSITNKSM